MSLFCGYYGFPAKFTGTAKGWTFRRALFHQQRIVAVLTLTGNGFKIENKLAFRVAIAGVEHLAIARFPLQQFALFALRTADTGFVRFIDNLGMVALRVVTASDKHAVTSLAQGQRRLAFWTFLSIQHFDDMAIGLRFQRPDMLAFRVTGTAEEGAVATTADHQLGPAFRTGFILPGGKNRGFCHNFFYACYRLSADNLRLLQTTVLPFADRHFHIREY